MATMDPSGAADAAITASLKQFDVPGIGDFDQGSVDGFGHAFIAGSGAITFLDYSTSHDITNPSQIIIRTVDGSGHSFGSIDDVAPLVGLGSQIPEPTSTALTAVGCFGLFVTYRRRQRRD